MEKGKSRLVSLWCPGVCVVWLRQSNQYTNYNMSQNHLHWREPPLHIHITTTRLDGLVRTDMAYPHISSLLYIQTWNYTPDPFVSRNAQQMAGHLYTVVLLFSC